MYVYRLSEKAAARKNRHESSGGKKISKEELVRTLMAWKHNITKPNTKGVMTTYQVRYCPNKDLCNAYPGGEVTFKDKSGFSGPYNHILACCFDKSEERLTDEYWEAKCHNTKRQASVTEAFPTVASQRPGPVYSILSQSDKDIFAWVNLCVMKNLPLSSVADKDFRDFSKATTHFSIKTLRNVILGMTVLVEKVLAEEMAVAGNESIVHDAWSKFGEHFFALFATYKATRTVVVDGVMTEKTGPIISLLSVAPLHTPTREVVDSGGFLPISEETEVVEASEFTAKVHAEHILHILGEYYGVDRSWLTNQTADSASVNIKLAKILGIPHVNCENHLLNNEVKQWTVNSTADEVNHNARVFEPGTVIKSVHQCMVSCKTNKNRAKLRNTGTELAPTIGCETRWSSSYNMMTKYGKLNDFIASASLDDQSDIYVPPNSHAFTRAVKNTTLMLADINAVAINMQGHMLCLDQCGKCQDILIKLSDEHRDDPNSHWHNNKFGKVYIDPESNKRPDKVFVSAVKKMKRREGSTLTAEETDVIKQWLPKRTTTMPLGSGAAPTAADLLAHLPATSVGKSSGEKRKSNEISAGGFDDCFDHVIGSAAEVERLWSIARYILTTTRAKLAPILFEALLFLRANRDLWDERTVQAALNTVRKDEKDEQLSKKLNEADDHVNFEGNGEFDQ
jgi:hypothetical protein